MDKFEDKEVSEAATTTQEWNMLYDTEELTPVCIFSDKLFNSEKGEIAKKIIKVKKNYNPHALGQLTQSIVTVTSLDLKAPGLQAPVHGL